MSYIPAAADELTKGQKRWGRIRAWIDQRGNGLRQHITDNMIQYVILCLFVLFIIVALAPRMFVSIYPGELGVLYSRFQGGTVTDHVYSEGFHVIAPWDTMTKYNVRVQEVACDVPILSKEGLQVKMNVSIRFYPEKTLLGFLHSDVGPDYVDRIVKPEVIANLRAVAAGYPIEELYSSVTPFERAVNESLERVARKYIVLDAVAVKSIDLPAKVQEAIEEKLSVAQRVATYQYKLELETLEARRKQTEASGIRRYNETINSSLNANVLKWEGINATKALANSPNTKTVILGNGSKELPVILGKD